MFARVPFRQAIASPGTMSGSFRPLSYQPATKTVVSNNFADLTRIYDDGVNLCLIERPLPVAIEVFVQGALKNSSSLEISEVVDPRRFDFAGLWPRVSKLDGYREWLADVSLLLNAFCELFDRSEVGLRLRTLDKAMCPRFHVDSVPARMICSYGGIGTEWLPEYAIDRSKLGLGGKGLADDVSGLIVDLSAIRSMPAYAVGLMKGSNWEGNEGRGLVHRSPAPTSAQPRRLLLTLDML